MLGFLGVQYRGDGAIGCLSQRFRKIVTAIRMLNDKIVFTANQFVNGTGCGGSAVDALPAKVTITERGIDEQSSRCQGTEQFGEVEWDLVELTTVVCQSGHVAGLTPTCAGEPFFFNALEVIWKCVKSTADRQYGNARFKCSGKDGFVSTQ